MYKPLIKVQIGVPVTERLIYLFYNHSAPHREGSSSGRIKTLRSVSGSTYTCVHVYISIVVRVLSPPVKRWESTYDLEDVGVTFNPTNTKATLFFVTCFVRV